MNIIYDSIARELSFPEIYPGVSRYFTLELNVTSYMIANSELRRADRREARAHIIHGNENLEASRCRLHR